MWRKRRERAAPEEHLEFVLLDRETVARRCACPRGRDHERLTSLTLAGAAFAAFADDVEAAA